NHLLRAIPKPGSRRRQRRPWSGSPGGLLMGDDAPYLEAKLPRFVTKKTARLATTPRGSAMILGEVTSDKQAFDQIVARLKGDVGTIIKLVSVGKKQRL